MIVLYLLMLALIEGDSLAILFIFLSVLSGVAD